MELELLLERTYLTKGTNGVISCAGKEICKTIELPWKDNQRRVSCIPEGRYELLSRYSPKFRNHFHLQNVPNRDLILIHPANNALKELNGCIAPVTKLTGEGTGSLSGAAMVGLSLMLLRALKEGKVFIKIIKSTKS